MDWLRAEHLRFCYAGETSPALRDVSFSLRKGEIAVLCGETGCGKSTLLRLIKRELAPRGELSGRLFFRGMDMAEIPEQDTARSLGFVCQQPDQQIVTDRVWHELAFGLENLGTGTGEMRRRVAETAAFFGLEGLFDRRTDELSGGQKQMLNLAAVTAMRPELLILDEPAAHLDPIAAADFMNAVRRLNRETGMTVLLSEHRLEDALPGADRLLIMERGRILKEGTPREVCGEIPSGSGLLSFLPAAVRVFRGVDAAGECPLSVAEGRAWLEERIGTRNGETGKRDGEPERREKSPEAGIGEGTREKEKEKKARKDREKETEGSAEAALDMREVTFRFERGGEAVLRSANLQVRPGEIFCLMGGNGSGKTTLLRAAAGLIRPESGEIRFFGKRIREKGRGLYDRGVAMLPQDPQSLFLRAHVREELADAGIKAGGGTLYDFSPLLDRHPYDLSGGEQRLLALTRVLRARPRLLLLDEPTGGLDALWRRRLTEILRGLRQEGMTLLLVTHDPEFAAETADRCALLFRGGVIDPEEPRRFFSGNSYYTTAACRMTRGLLPDCVTVGDAVRSLQAAAGSLQDAAEALRDGERSLRDAAEALREAPGGEGGPEK